MKKEILLMLALLFFITACTSCTDKADRPVDIPDDSLSQWKKLNLVWKASKTFEGPPAYTKVIPLIVNDKIIISYENTTQCLNKLTGDIVWTYTNSTDANITNCNANTIILDGDRIFACMGQKLLVCLNINDGSLRWKYHIERIGYTNGFFYGSQSPDAVFIVRQSDKRVISLSKASGAELWVSEESAVPRKPVVYDSLHAFGGPATYYEGKVYVGCALVERSEFGDGSLAIFDAATGKLLTSKVFPYPDSTSNFPMWKNANSSLNDNTIVPVSDGLLLSLGFGAAKINKAGELLWQTIPFIDFGVSYMRRSFLQIFNNIICGYNNGNTSGAFAFGLDLVTGKQVWAKRMDYLKSNPGHTILSFTPTIADGIIYKVTDDLKLYANDCFTGETKFASSLVSPLADHGLPAEAYEGALGVEGDYIYFCTFNYIVCMKKP